MVEQAPAEYYIDESGNTGDLSTVKIDSYFVEQRMFALAAFGCTLDQDFTIEEQRDGAWVDCGLDQAVKDVNFAEFKRLGLLIKKVMDADQWLA